ncbi:hypothetical protein CLU79DRAFT_445877 [Phycomyces nitens]|nr:hypothetical protein CLU79DRAFT_445877 [Phycomyces nitens]
MTLTLSLETTKTSSSPCSICLQIPDNQTFLEPCYHSFCFSCILRWINITPSCPLCKQLTDSLVYNIDEEKGTFREYTLAGKNADDEHDPPVDPLPLTMEQRLYAQRQKIYHSSLKVIHPKPLQKFVNLSIIEPQHIQRVSLMTSTKCHKRKKKNANNFLSRHACFFSESCPSW